MLCHVRTERTRTQANEKIDLTSAINQSKTDDKDEYCGSSYNLFGETNSVWLKTPIQKVFRPVESEFEVKNIEK